MGCFMTLKLENLIDVPKLQKLLDHLYNATGIPSTIVGLHGEIITTSGWRDICEEFHRINPITKANCIESDASINKQIHSGKEYVISKCRNGLTDIGLPIIIGQEHIATIFQGQFLMTEPDLDFFRAQAQRVGFDEAGYIQAIKSTPIIPESELYKTIAFLTDLGGFIAELGDSTLKNKQSYDELKETHIEMTALYEQMTATEMELRHHYDLLQQSHEDLFHSQKRYELVTEGSHDIVWDIDLLSNEIYLTDSFSTLFGIDKNTIKTIKDFGAMVHPDDYESVKANLYKCIEQPESINFEYVDSIRAYTSANELLWLSAKGQILTDQYGKAIRIAGALRDVTDIMNYQKSIERMAYTDNLTGAYNRNQLLIDLVQSIKLIQNENIDDLAIIFLDLDDFKNINDVYGHQSGDTVLIEITKKLNALTPPNTKLYRFGGDEFALIVRNHAIGELEALSVQILKDFKKPIIFDDKPFYITTSIGICQYSDSISTPDDLLMNSDTAMYKAKGNGKNSYVIFENHMQTQNINKRRIEEALNRALNRDELFLVFQPKVNLATDEVAGFEALVRWRLKGNDIISPAIFIPIAEERGLIKKIDQWVVNEAFSTIKIWEKKGYEYDHVSINLSPKSLTNDIVDYLKTMITLYSIDTTKVHIEITENVLINSYDYAVSIIRKLKVLGFQIALDDFGKGYSSLSYLKTLPIDILKIDKIFVDELLDDSNSIIDLIINIGQRYNMKIIAEGVETKEQMDTLKSYGCDYYQGYYFSKPIHGEPLIALLEK